MSLDRKGKRKDGTYVGLTQGSEIVRKRSVRYPSVFVPNISYRNIRGRNENHLLLSPSDQPIITSSYCDRLDASNITSRKRFRYGKCNVLLSSEDVRDIPRLDFRRPEIEDRGQGNDTTIQQPIHETARPKTGKFEVEDELRRI